ncbi:MAG: DegV family protein [Bacilli bacterium]|nr:DegV family protein [Bacilli bacterium]
MEKTYQIITDSCCDISKEIRQEMGLDYVHMGLVVDGVEMRADLDWEDYTPEEFYGWLQSGKKMKTTQVSIPEFVYVFTKYLEKGLDIIYLGCATALSGSVNVCSLAIEELKEKFPDRRIVAYDTHTSAYTMGFLVQEAAKKQAEGLTMDELIAWVDVNRKKFNQFATVDTLTYLKNAGRVKGAKAFMGNLLGMKPIIISDTLGNNLTIKTVRGTKASLNELVECVKEVIDVEANPRIYVGQGMAMDNALKLKERFENEIPGCIVEINWIGPIIGTTCGPGIIGVFCYGKEVTRFEGDGK